jgi:Arc/MetJ family transcription regulator
MHQVGMLMQMRTTINIDDALLGRATQLSGLREKTAVVRAGLEALVARESARRLAALGGSDTTVRRVPRRRTKVRRKPA